MAKEQMKLFDPCIKVGRSVFNLSEEDAAAIVEQMRNVAKGITQGDVQVRVKKIMRAESAMQKKWARQKRLQAKLNKIKDTRLENRVMDTLAERERIERENPGLWKKILKWMGKEPNEQLPLSDEVIARYTGSTRLRTGGQDSAAGRMLAAERANQGYIFGKMLRDHNMTEKELHKWMDDEKNLEDVVTESFGPNGEGFDLENPTPHTQNALAHTFARARIEVKKFWVDSMNAEGAMIGWLPNHTVTQYHDPLKVHRVGKEQWIADQLEFIGQGTEAEARTFGLMDEAQRRQFLDAAWNNIVEGNRTSIDEAPEVKVPGNLAKKLSQHRKIHYKSDKAWLENFKKYGGHDLKTSMWTELKNLADDAIMIQEFGTNPKASQEKLWAKLKAYAENPPDGKARAWNEEGRRGVKTHWQWVDQSAYHIANSGGWGPNIAALTQGYLMIQNMSKLGGSVFPSFSDLSTAVQTYRYHGMDYMEGMQDHFKFLTKTLTPDERIEVMYAVGEFNDLIIGGFHSRHAVTNPEIGTMSKMQDFFFKANLLAGWTYNNRAAVQFVISGNIARKLSRNFEDLDPRLQRVLNQYNISDTDWQIMRDVGVKTLDAEGNLLPETAPSETLDLNRRQYFTPDLLEAVAKNPEMSLVDRQAYQNLAFKMRNFYVQEGRIGIPEPDAADRAIMTAGTQRGTLNRSVWEALFQFRSFPLTYLRRLGPRYAHQGTIYTIGNLAAMSMIGYVSMTAKDILLGKEPKPLDNPKTWANAFIFSGAGGIMGDFVFNDFRGYGRSVPSVVMGPLGDELQNWGDFFTRLVTGDDAAAKAFNNVIRMAPFANLWYTRTALDYMFIYNIQNFLNPGVLRRREKRMKRDYDQQYMKGMRPSTSKLRKASPLYMMGVK